MASLLLVVIYLIFISLGLPDSLLGSGWPEMQVNFSVPSSYAGYVSMTISFICTFKPYSYKEISYKMDYNSVDWFNNNRPVRVFCLRRILDVIFVRGSIRTRSRSHRCFCKPLCCKQLFRLSYEFLTLFLWSRCGYKPLYYGTCT